MAPITRSVEDAHADLHRKPTVPALTAAAALGMDPHALYRAIRDGSVPATRIGRSWRVPAKWVRGVLGEVTDDDAA